MAGVAVGSGMAGYAAAAVAVAGSTAPPGATGTNTCAPDTSVASAVGGRLSAVGSAVGAAVGEVGCSLRQAVKNSRDVISNPIRRCIDRIIYGARNKWR